MKKFLAVLPIITLVVIPALSFAQQLGTLPGGTPAPINNLTGASNVYNILNAALTAIYIIFFIIAAIFIIIAAFGYLTAAGDEEKVKAAKNRLIYAVIAIVVALIAVGAAALVRGAVQGGTSGGGL